MKLTELKINYDKNRHGKTNRQKLLSMLQPKEYESKIKLYCNKCTFTLENIENVRIFGGK